MKNQSEFKAMAVLQVVVATLFGYLGVGAGLCYLAEKYLNLPRIASLGILMGVFVLAMRQIYKFAKPEANS